MGLCRDGETEENGRFLDMPLRSTLKCSNFTRRPRFFENQGRLGLRQRKRGLRDAAVDGPQLRPERGDLALPNYFFKIRIRKH